MPAMIRFQEGQLGGTGMFNQIAIDVVRWERERMVQETLRRGRLLRGEDPDPDLSSVAVAARLRRRGRLVQPARLATP